MDTITVGNVLGGFISYEQSGKGVTRFYFDHEKLKNEDGSDVGGKAVALYILTVGAACAAAKKLDIGDRLKMVGRISQGEYTVWDDGKPYIVQDFIAHNIVKCRKDD